VKEGHPGIIDGSSFAFVARRSTRIDKRFRESDSICRERTGARIGVAALDTGSVNVSIIDRKNVSRCAARLNFSLLRRLEARR